MVADPVDRGVGAKGGSGPTPFVQQQLLKPFLIYRGRVDEIALSMGQSVKRDVGCKM